MKLLILLLFTNICFSQEINFSDKVSYSLDKLKEKYKVHEIGVFNYYINQTETYLAFDFEKILDDVYGQKWKEQTYIKVDTLHKYQPYIETYKFKKRKPYLAFAKKYSKSFNTINAKKNIVDLSPYYLIWVENYKGEAAKRRSHWVYRIKGIELVKYAAVKIMPSTDATKEIFWGYKNYMKQCIACHAIDGFGGVKSGSILTEEILAKEDKYLMRYISNPVYYNKKSRMPLFPVQIDKRTTRIKNIVKYIRYISKRDFKTFGKASKNANERKVELDELIDIINELP